jgi:beta-galactosidase
VAVPDSIWDFRVRRLKEMGSNAYRCAHNPPAREFLEACDRQGMLVMDENRNFNASPEYVRQLEWLIRRDRNHPSVILWSVFNEEPMQGTEVGYELVRRMEAVVKRLDTNRPVTAAMNGGMGSAINVSQAVEVVGFNYQQGSYDGFHTRYPNVPLTSSEDTSAYMTRGVYEADDKACMADSYDDHAAPWGATHRKAWKAIADRPFIAGGFVWTGFDYRGEPQKYSWPSVSSVFGIMDVCGFPKASYYMHQAAWVEDRPILKLIPHWNWKGREGQNIRVLVMTNLGTVELFLNGKSLGEKVIDKLEGSEWSVPYAPGKLEAVAKKDGKEVAREVVETTGEPVALRLVPDRTALAGDGADALPITVSAVDAQGREVPTANPMVTFELTGPGAIIGHGNGDNTSHEPEKGNQRSLFHGLAQVLLQSQRASSGSLVLVAKADGLKSAETKIEVRPVAPLPAVPPTDPVFSLTKWRMSPVTKDRSDPNQKLGETDMNSWLPVTPGTLEKFDGGSWAVFRTTFTPVQEVQKHGGTLVFKNIAGAAEVWLDEKKIAEKTDVGGAPLEVGIPAGPGLRTLSVVVNANGKPKAGFFGVVIIRPNL